MKFLKSTALAAGVAMIASAGSATTYTAVEVLGTSNIFKAPGASAGDGTEPNLFTFAANTGVVLTIDGVTGLTECCGGTPSVGADGGSLIGTVTNVQGARGIMGGYLGSAQMFLVGVFLNSASLPTAGNPGQTDFNGRTGALNHMPALNAAFFIGDGLTGNGAGTQQNFYAPAGADTLVLGFLDSFNFVGGPSYYDDNNGSLTVDFTLEGTPAVPLPAGLPLVLTGLGALALFRRGRRG